MGDVEDSCTFSLAAVVMVEDVVELTAGPLTTRSGGSCLSGTLKVLWVGLNPPTTSLTALAWLSLRMRSLIGSAHLGSVKALAGLGEFGKTWLARTS